MTRPRTYRDRVAHAEGRLEDALTETSPELAWVYAAAAQAEATLALAEQQRIANLIALERLHLGRPDRNGTRRPVGVSQTFTMAEIDVALDLEGIAERHS